MNKIMLYTLLFWMVVGAPIMFFANQITEEEVPVAESHVPPMQQRLHADPQGSQNAQHEIKTLLQKTRPCVVNIVSYISPQAAGFNQNPSRLLEPYQDGNKIVSSGVIIKSNGLVITTKDAVPSNHIEVKVFRRTPNVYKADVVHVNESLNLALLKIQNINQVPFCPMGDSNTIEVGDIVFAIGSPYGFSQTVTSGIISSSRAKVNIQGKLFPHLIQTDAVINEGNNGGPIINIEGKVIGICAALYSESAVYSGIGFAIPINDIKGMINQEAML